MLDDHKILQAKASGGGSVEFEVNWNNHKDVAKCKMIRIRIGDKEMDIQRDDLVNILLHIGTVSDQKNLLPAQLTKVRKFERLLTFEFTAKKDIKEGQKIQIQAPWIDTGIDQEEVMAGNLKKKSLNPFKKYLT